MISSVGFVEASAVCSPLFLCFASTSVLCWEKVRSQEAGVCLGGYWAASAPMDTCSVLRLALGTGRAGGTHPKLEEGGT